MTAPTTTLQTTDYLALLDRAERHDAQTVAIMAAIVYAADPERDEGEAAGYVGEAWTLFEAVLAEGKKRGWIS